MATNYKINNKDHNDAIISPRFCADHDTTLELWISTHCSSFLIKITSSSSATKNDKDLRDRDGNVSKKIINRAFTFDHLGSASRYGRRDFVMQDADGIELLRIYRKVSATWRNRYQVYQGESRVMSIREANLSHWNHSLYVFLDHDHHHNDDVDAPTNGSATLGIVDTGSGRRRRPDYKVKRSTGLYFSGNVTVSILDARDNRKIAEAQMYPDGRLSWSSICGHNPDYRVRVSWGVDQAFIALLLNLYHIISFDNRELYGGGL